MIRQFARAFSTASNGANGRFSFGNAFSRLTSVFRAPVKHVKRQLEPGAPDYNPLTNTTEEAFDEVAQEWQAVIASNPYDVNTFNMLEHAMIANFGTVDNPHVIFTSDAPFRYVGCTGLPNEDDYEGHEFLIFMLREGPLQRCQSCGQVFKLVRLRQEMSPEMDYYLSNFVPYDIQEMNDMDTTINMSMLRFQKDSIEYSQFETPSNYVYSLVNPDEHDRLLTDPAYRLEKTKKLEEKMYVYVYSLKDIEKEYEENHGPLMRYPMNKVDYETLIEVEKSIMKMNRLFRKVDKFNNRKYIDRENHERREKRMQQRAKERWEGNYTLFYGGLTEEEQKYRDYFQTDIEKDPEDEEIEEKLDETEIFARGDYSLDKYDFQESYTRNPEEDASSIAEKKAWNFKYRRAKDPVEVYERRESRMIARQIQRFGSPDNQFKPKELAEAIQEGNETSKLLAEKSYLTALVAESIQQYKDYYESEGEEELKKLDSLDDSAKLHFVRVFEDYTKLVGGKGGSQTFPKRPWDESLGFWQNFLLDVGNYREFILPTANALINVAETSELPESKQELETLSIYSDVTAIEGDKVKKIEAKKEIKKEGE